MSTRSRRTRSGGEDHVRGSLNVKNPTVTPNGPRVTVLADTIPRREPPTITSVLHVPDCPYSLEEIHFLLWYTLTTTLSPDKIAELFNHFFSPAKPVDRWTIADIVHVLETRWEADGKSFGRDFRLRRPTAHGTCPCDFKDFDIDCVDVKRTTKTRQNEKYLSIAACLWDQSAAELVVCPRGNRTDRRLTTVQKDTQPLMPFAARDNLLSFVHNAYLHTLAPARTALSFVYWFSVLHVWLVLPETLNFPIQRTLYYYLHHRPIATLTTLHWVFESTMDGLPTFLYLRTTPFVELAWRASFHFWQTYSGVGIALALCSILGILSDFIVGHQA